MSSGPRTTNNGTVAIATEQLTDVSIANIVEEHPPLSFFPGSVILKSLHQPFDEKESLIGGANAPEGLCRRHENAHIMW